ncbi:MAG: GyrI-like domain-containing protein [Solobacterium sp.]|nr:GyrI-like domain-containing protein [Solobacterium sp.]
MSFDYKKEYREYYLPKTKPQIVDVPEMNFIAVSGKGDPNQPDGDYKKAVGMLYTIAYTIKMSRKTGHRIEGYFDYVVPPLEGFWRQEGREGMDYSYKEDFIWTSVIRLPDFVTEADFRWAVQEAERKKHMDLSKAEFLRIREGLCVQCMHIGPYDDEPETISKMDRFLEENGYENDFSEERIHHEIYLSDVTRTAPAKLKTVIRHPVRRK